jgi:hypothetical protein
MSTPIQLVDIAELKRLMAEVQLGDERMNEYVNARWLKYVEWWDSRARGAKRQYLLLRGIVVVASALIPALVALSKYAAAYSDVFSIASIVASVAVAICAGLESLNSFGDIWREKRNAAEIIKSEGFYFLQLAGPYKVFHGHQDAFRLFAENVEEIIRGEIKDYIRAVAPKQGGNAGSPRDGNG